MIKKILIAQTAFPGDVILATALMESIHHAMPEATLDILVRRGNESIFNNHPYANKILIWDKSKNKLTNLVKLIGDIRKEKYDLLINLQRFASSGILTAFSGAKETRGFKKNPFSFTFSKKVVHKIGDGQHETERNHDLISDLIPDTSLPPKLYPTEEDYRFTEKYKTDTYICIAPGSVWFTKKFPESKWIKFIAEFGTANSNVNVYLLGSSGERELCERILIASQNKNCQNLAGAFSFLQSAALMKDAKMNFVNDSAPLHLASAMKAKTTAIFCSTIPAFGFGPLSPDSRIVQIKETLYCRPCGLHGFNYCPEGHFKCALDIDTSQLSL